MRSYQVIKLILTGFVAVQENIKPSVLMHLSSYSDLLLKSQRCTMQVSRLRVLCIEVFKTLKNLKPIFMHDIFKIKSSTYSSRNPNDLQHYRPNQVTFGSNSLRSLGPQIWNGLPNEIKSAENLNSFKHLIKSGMAPIVNAMLASI